MAQITDRSCILFKVQAVTCGIRVLQEEAEQLGILTPELDDDAVFASSLVMGLANKIVQAIDAKEAPF